MKDFELSHLLDQISATTREVRKNIPSIPALKGEEAIVGNYTCLDSMRNDINKLERNYTKCLIRSKSESQIVDCVHRTAQAVSETRFGLINPNHVCGPVVPPKTVKKVTSNATKCISDTSTSPGVKTCVAHLQKSVKHKTNSKSKSKSNHSKSSHTKSSHSKQSHPKTTHSSKHQHSSK